MQFRFRRRGGHTYVYLIQKARRDGKVANVAEMYLGTQEEVARRLTDPEVGTAGLEFLPYPFGTSAAFLTGVRRLVDDAPYRNGHEKHLPAKYLCNASS